VTANQEDTSNYFGFKKMPEKSPQLHDSKEPVGRGVRPFTEPVKKRAPPTDRGELHIGGVAVFTTTTILRVVAVGKHRAVGEVSRCEKLFSGIGQSR
jgi:hypothetical protein